MMNFKGKRIVVLGAGKTGLAVAAYLLQRGARVTISDTRSPDMIDGFDSLMEMGVLLDIGGHSMSLLKAADLIVKSPGIPPYIPFLQQAAERNISVIGEIDLFADSWSGRVVAITGTNGKSTTTTVCGNIFRAWKEKVFVGGNIGTPLVTSLLGPKIPWAVIELSSFQIEESSLLKPKYALLLNLTPDHLDRYRTLEEYFEAKRGIFSLQNGHDRMVLNADDSRVMELAAKGRGKRILFSSSQRLEEGFCREGEELVWRMAGVEERFPIAEVAMSGVHNLENLMAAMIPPLMEGCPAEIAWREASRFPGLPHRMELVATIDQVRYYNDSKGTNLGSVEKSLEGFTGGVTLIAGGKHKGDDYRSVAALIGEKVSELVLIGQAAPMMEEAFAGVTRIHRAGSMEEAVYIARGVTPAGGSVLLSPGCSSFDMFKNFEDRGEVFAAAVRSLQVKERV